MNTSIRGRNGIMSNSEWVYQISVVVAAVVFAAFVLSVLPFFLYQRSKVAKHAGQLLLRVARPRVRRATLVFFTVWWIAVAVQWAALWLAWSPRVTTDYARIAAAVIHTLVASAALIAYWFGATNAYFEVREEGIIHYGTGFWPWERLKHYAWKDWR